MKPWVRVLSVGLLFSMAAWAQAPAAPSKYIRVVRHEVKPGHAAEYAGLVRQFRGKLGDANYHWLAAMPATGSGDRVDIITFYDSFAQMQEAQQAFMKSPAGGLLNDADFNRSLADSVVGTNAIIARYREDLSYRPEMLDLAHSAFWDLTVFRLNPGSEMDFNDLEKEAIDLHKRANIDEHWVAYEVEYGAPGSTMMFLSDLKSLAELDKDLMEQHKAVFNESIRRRFSSFARQGVASEESSILRIAPEISHPAASLASANPDFWNVKPESSPAAAKKKQKQTTAPKPQ